MKWLLVVIVAQSPVKTDLLFTNLSTCLAAEHEMRTEWAQIYNGAVSKKASKETLDLIRSQMASGTCIPAI